LILKRELTTATDGKQYLVKYSAMNQIEIYRSKDKEAQVEVSFDGETFWLSLNQISELFERDKSVISRHLLSIYKEGELNRKSTVAKNATVQTEGGRKIARRIEYYNLDVILSVGYRVNSKRGTQFRQWATQRLKDHLVKGYSINQKRLDQLQQTIQLIKKSGQVETLSLSEAKGLLEIISNYTQSFILLNRFDNQTLQSDELSENVTYEIEYKEALKAIAELKRQLIQKKEASELFGKQKDDSFAGILGNVVQSFGGEYLYKSIEEQAAHLLYFTIKNHPFTDGNKRIGALSPLLVFFTNKRDE
jgi:hypothetical protein